MLSHRQIQHDGIYWAISRHGTADTRRYGSVRAVRGVVPVPVCAEHARELIALGLRVADASKWIPVRDGTTVRFEPCDGLPWEIREITHDKPRRRKPRKAKEE